MLFNRIQISALLEWKKSSARKPLILQGARQVGKTSLVKFFGEMYFHDFAYFNFEEEPLLKELFESTKKVDILLDQLSGIHGKKIEAETLSIP